MRLMPSSKEKHQCIARDATITGVYSKMKKILLILLAIALLVLGNGVYAYLNNKPHTQQVPGEG